MLLWAQTTEGACSATPIPATDVLSIGSSVSVLCWEDGRACGIFVRGDADVNGCAALPFHVLDHRDEIRVDGKLYYIGAASPAEPYPFEPADQRILCARCGDEPVAPELVLRCPLCDALHHHDCFDYEPTCGACKRATSWMPDSLEENEPWHH